MDDYSFQQQLYALKERVSELSNRYSSTMRPHDPFVSQIHELKAHMASMQQRLEMYENSTRQNTSPSAVETRIPPATTALDPLSEGPSALFQSINKLQTNVEALDSRVESLQSTISDMEDKIDNMDPNRFTPPGSAVDSEGLEIPNYSRPIGVGDSPHIHVPELRTHPVWRHQAASFTLPEIAHVENDLRSYNNSLLNSFGKLATGNAEQAQAVQELPAGSGTKSFVTSGTELPEHARFPPVENVVSPTCRQRPAKGPRVVQKFQDIEDALECLCGIDNGSLPRADKRTFAGAPLCNCDLLETVCTILTYLANKNLEEAISKGDKNLHFKELRAIVEQHKYPTQGTVMDDGNSTRCKRSRRGKQCLTHNHADWIVCRKERKRNVTEKTIRQREEEQIIIAREKRWQPAFDHCNAASPAVAQPPEALEGLAFRDREIARLDQQLGTAQERLRVSEEAVLEQQNHIIQLQRGRDDCNRMIRDWAVRNYELKDEICHYRNALQSKENDIMGLHDQIDEKNDALRNWKESWNRLNESYRDASDKLEVCEYNLQEERKRRESAIDRVVREHRKDLKALESFCEEKDSVIYRLEQVVSRGGKLLEEKDDEIERLQRELQAMTDVKEHALQMASRTARLLDERDAELANLKEGLRSKSTKLSSYDVFEEGRHAHTVTGMEAEEVEPPRNSSDLDIQNNRVPANGTPMFSRAPNRASHRPREPWRSEIFNAENQQGSMGNSSTRRRLSDGKKRGMVEGRVTSLPNRSEIRNGRQISAPFSARNREMSPNNCRQYAEGQALDDATLRPPLPAPPVRHVVSEANLRTGSPKDNAMPARKSLSKYRSTQAMQAYAESEAEGGGEFGGEV